MFARLALATLMTLAAGAAAANDAELATARHAAEVADAALVAQRLALWQQLDAGQKAAFAAPERAWLNGGRDKEVQQCAGATPSALQLEQCRLQVTERHRAALAPPLVQAAR